MDMRDYAITAMSTAVYPRQHRIIYPALKLSGEAGEVSEKIGKALRDDLDLGDPEIRLALLHELGDVLWYITALARDLDSSLDEVAKLNNMKLQDRARRGQLHGSGDNR